MMGLSVWHILLLLVVIILVFGTSKLKSLGKDLGGAVKDFKDSVRDEDEKQNLEKQRIIDVNHTVANKTSDHV
ncbi:MAG: Sec-independent protein translocase subunit TatA [Acinetobacter sp.]|jgi:sec-independent protein translocase protein TatA|uniref:Sec-independent protein translocase subunit TatA n=1 Tax=unclassified Acinetobacter TaxID=196816 RepID=UPI001F4BB827|nr:MULTISPECIES: Sec-independent protein translocase subunit TatA [unclassified Acinetobacter]MCH7311413.1 Sec-independent protein translocase subunit TatA [Acinetobacter sp. ANC 4805]